MCVRLLRSVVFVCHFFCSFPTLCHCQHSLLLVCGCFGCKLHFCWNKCDGNNAASSNTVAGLKDRHWQWLWGKPSFSFRLTFHFFNSFQAMELLQFRSWCGCCLIVCLPLTVWLMRLQSGNYSFTWYAAIVVASPGKWHSFLQKSDR